MFCFLIIRTNILSETISNGNVTFTDQYAPNSIESKYKVKIINTTIESTGETVSTSIVSETNMFESTNDVSESSINNANVDFENNENDYVKIVIGLFIAGGIIIIGVIVYMINKKKKEVV